MNIYENHLYLLDQEKALKAQILASKEALYIAHQERFDEKDNGTINVEDQGFKLTVVKKETIKVDQKLAADMDVGFRVKYELDKKSYDKMTIENRKRVDECLTATPATPTFKVEKLA